MKTAKKKTVKDLKDINSKNLGQICQELNLDHRQKAVFRLKHAGLYTKWKRHKKSRIKKRYEKRREISHPLGKSRKEYLIEMRNMILTRIVYQSNNNWKIKRAVDYYKLRKDRGVRSLELTPIIKLSNLVNYHENNSNYHKLTLRHLSYKSEILLSTVSRILKEWGLAPKRKTVQWTTPEKERIIRNGYNHDVSSKVLAEKIGVERYVVNRRYKKMNINEGVSNNL